MPKRVAIYHGQGPHTVAMATPPPLLLLLLFICIKAASACRPTGHPLTRAVIYRVPKATTAPPTGPTRRVDCVTFSRSAWNFLLNSSQLSSQLCWNGSHFNANLQRWTHSFICFTGPTFITFKSPAHWKCWIFFLCVTEVRGSNPSKARKFFFQLKDIESIFI